MLVLRAWQVREGTGRLVQDHPFEMRYLHTLDTDQLREMDEEERQRVEDYARAAELLAEDMAMERYYEAKYATP